MGRKSYKRRHYLDELFEIMGKDTRMHIKSYFYDNSAIVREYFERQYGRRISNVGLFKFCLKANRDAFRAMRYV